MEESFKLDIFFIFCGRITLRRRVLCKTRPAWAGFKTAEEGIAIIMSCILLGK
jgi:hypothetical protein